MAENVLRVLVLHRLAQERQGPSWFSAAVPHLNPITQRELRGGVPQVTRLAERFLPPKLSRPRSEVGTLTGMARRFSRNDWNWKLRCWAAFLTGTRFPESSANRGVPSSTCREGKATQLSRRSTQRCCPAFSSGLPSLGTHPSYSSRYRSALGNHTPGLGKGYISRLCFLTGKGFTANRNLHISLPG